MSATYTVFLVRLTQGTTEWYLTNIDGTYHRDRSKARRFVTRTDCHTVIDKLMVKVKRPNPYTIEEVEDGDIPEKEKTVVHTVSVPRFRLRIDHHKNMTNLPMWWGKFGWGPYNKSQYFDTEEECLTEAKKVKVPEGSMIQLTVECEKTVITTMLN